LSLFCIVKQICKVITIGPSACALSVRERWWHVAWANVACIVELFCSSMVKESSEVNGLDTRLMYYNVFCVFR
jgi:hypothetical protein